jgi:hypothetical protein
VERGLVVLRAVAGAALVLALICAGTVARTDQAPPGPEARAVAYLTIEVPRWRREHAWYSCHNNGDATRALLAAARKGHDIGAALDDTRTWLVAPDRWAQKGTPGGSEDLPLAQIQFGSALAALVEAGRGDRLALTRAAELVAAHQQPDGSWVLSPTQTIGGATFYGRALATAMARLVLAGSTTPAGRASLTRADAWLRSFTPVSVLDASSVLIGLGASDDPASRAQRARALAIVKEGQGPDGGWGPYTTSQSEVFDTALAVRSLMTLTPATAAPAYDGGELSEARRRGRAYLVAQQEDDGSWVETTRPSGGESYAQRISTTAWALLALLVSS